MPQIQSQKKRVKTNNKRNLAVSAQKSALRTSIKKVLAAVDVKLLRRVFTTKTTQQDRNHVWLKQSTLLLHKKQDRGSVFFHFML